MKIKISHILNGTSGWIDVCGDYLPEPFERVVIRICDDSQIIGEDKTTIVYLEDVAVGSIDEDNIWSVSPPDPRFDYSPLSNFGNLKPGAKVTHWRHPAKDASRGVDELLGWDTRWDRIREYKHLRIEVDEENVKDVYTALMKAGNLLALSSDGEVDDPNSETRKYYEIICDLQNFIDVDTNKYGTTDDLIRVARVEPNNRGDIDGRL